MEEVERGRQWTKVRLYQQTEKRPGTKDEDEKGTTDDANPFEGVTKCSPDQQRKFRDRRIERVF
jgi:hypothetical protein